MGVALALSFFFSFSSPHTNTHTHTMSHLAVYGGAGALGRALVTYFKERGFVSIYNTLRPTYNVLLLMPT